MRSKRFPRFGDLRIRNQINLIVCIAAALLVLTMGAVYLAFDALMTRQAAERFDDLAAQGGGSLRDTLRGIDANARTYAHILEIAGFPDFAGLDAETGTYLANAYAAIHNLSDDMQGVALVTASGRTAVAGADAAAEAALQALAGKPGFLAEKPARAAFLGIAGQDASGRPYFAHAAPILAPGGEGRIAGWLVTLIGSGAIRETLDALTGGDPRMTGMLMVDGSVRLSTTPLLENEQVLLAAALDMAGSADGGVAGAGGEATPDKAGAGGRASADIRFRRAPALLLRADVPGTGWRLGLVVPRAIIKEPILSLAWIGFAILAAGAAVLAAASVATIRAITRPVEGMAAAMAEVGKPGAAREITVSGHNEVGVMATHINGLIRRLDEADRRTREAERRLDRTELARVRSELSYYQSQINPHFLYNTLESIRSMALVYDAEEIARLAVATASIFRYAVRDEAETVLGEEIACVREYVTVMQLRFPGRYGLSVRVAEGLERQSMPRMLLQPLVENAFRHGFARRSGPGRIHIAASCRDGICRVVVCDNGAGIPADRLEALRRQLAEAAQAIGASDAAPRGVMDDESGPELAAQHPVGAAAFGKPHTAGVSAATESQAGTGIGLLNIQRRLLLRHGAAFGLSIDSREGRWTRVEMRMPCDVAPLSAQSGRMV